MDCKRRESVQDYLDGQMTAGEAAAMAAHLHECNECRREAEALTSLDAAIRALPTPDPGRQFTDAVLRLVCRSPVPMSRPGFSLSAWEAASLALLYGVLALLLLPASGWLAQVEGYQTVLALLRHGVVGLAPLRDALAALGSREWLSAVPPAAGGTAAAGAALVLAVLYRGSLQPSDRRVLR